MELFPCDLDFSRGTIRVEYPPWCSSLELLAQSQRELDAAAKSMRLSGMVEKGELHTVSTLWGLVSVFKIVTDLRSS
jgi:hypothetical protein